MARPAEGATRTEAASAVTQPLHHTDLRMRLSAAPWSPAMARAEIGRVLEACLPDEVRHTVSLLASELVANAVLHVGADVELRLLVGEAPAPVRVDVIDCSPYVPKARDPGLSTTGRGLLLVDSLSDRWGVDLTARGKSVWFEVDPPGDGSSEPASTEH